MNIRHDTSSSPNERSLRHDKKVPLVSKERSSRPTSKQDGAKPMTTSYITHIFYWKCNLCNIELPNDDLADIRKERHRKFHIDESIVTGNRKRNWTFGEVKYVLT